MAFVPSDHEYPKDYFALPVNRPIKLSGTFGELRSGHFHAGIDIKTLNGRPGEKIYASAGGYVARIKVEPGGYGRALYVAHPNGYTTVYAHLDRFTPDLEAYVKSKQYELERFSIDLHPRPDQFSVVQGEHIAYLGNSGSSMGPHLHFEIRRSAGQIPVNPFLFGLPIQDQVRPDIQSLKVYYLDDKRAQLHVKNYPVHRTAPGVYRLDAPLHEGAWRVAFGLKVIDQMNGTRNRNGIYALEMQVDQNPQYAFTLQDMPFTKTRYLNAHLDYAARYHDEGTYHRCYRLPGNPLDIYEEWNEKGIVTLYSEKKSEITLTARDVSGNISTLTFDITRDTNIWQPAFETYDYTVSNKNGLSIDTEQLKIHVPASAFYEYATISYRSDADPSDDIYGYQHDIGTESIPLHTYGTISVRHHNLPPGLADKAYVARCSPDGAFVSCGGSVNGQYITTRIRSLGNFTVALDTIKPRIEPIHFSADMRNFQRMVFRISDSQRVTDGARGLRYFALVDDKWVLMEYDAKNDLLIHRFDEHISAGEHQLILTVRDDRNNIAKFEGKFVR